MRNPYSLFYITVTTILVFFTIATGCGGKGSPPSGYDGELSQTTIVPSLSGTDMEEARQALEDLELTLGTCDEEYSETVPAGKVIESRPPAGTEVEKGTSVSLLLSKGPKPVNVPDLGGKPEGEAVAALQSLGLQVDVQRTYHEAIPQGRVISTTPAPGTPLTKGQKITLTVSLGSAFAVCPRCGGKGTITTEETCPECEGTGTCFT